MPPIWITSKKRSGCVCMKFQTAYKATFFFPDLCWSIGLDYATMWGIFWCLHLKIDTIFYQNSKNFTVLREEVFELIWCIFIEVRQWLDHGLLRSDIVLRGHLTKVLIKFSIWRHHWYPKMAERCHFFFKILVIMNLLDFN